MSYFIIILMIYMIFKFTKRTLMFSRIDFSNWKYYIAFILSNILYILCFVVYIYTEIFNIIGSGWWLIILYVGICSQFYSTIDLAMNNKIKIPFPVSFLKILVKIMVLLIVFLLCVTIRAKYLGYY